jgi:hypothetical protein
MRCDLFGIAHEFEYTLVASDLVDCAIEVGDLAIGGEYIGPQKVSHTTLADY